MLKYPTKKELLKMPVRPWRLKCDEEYDEILIVPAGTKHESGFMHIAVIGVMKEGEEVEYEICAYPDDISFLFPIVETAGIAFAQVRTDCLYPQGILRYHGFGKFKVSAAISSVNITFQENTKKPYAKNYRS